MNTTQELDGLIIHATNVIDLLSDEKPHDHDHKRFLIDAISIIGSMVSDLNELEGRKESIGDRLKSQIKSAHRALYGGQNDTART